MPRLTQPLRPLHLVIALQAAIADLAVGADFTVDAGTTQNAGQTLAGTGTVASGGVLETANGTVAVTVQNGSSTLDNAGVIRQTGTARAIDANTGAPVLVINNLPGGVISATGNVAIRLNRPAGHYVINNQGTVEQVGITAGGERAIKADADFTSEHNQLINGSESNRDAVIRTSGNDAVRLGSHFTLVNWGAIRSTGIVNTSCPGYMAADCVADLSAADGVAIENERSNVAILNHGSITGPRHGIDGGDPISAMADSDLIGIERLLIRSADGNGVVFDKVTSNAVTQNVTIANPVVINYADGQIIGKNGSGVGLDGHGVVFNYGLISGNYAGAGNVYDHEGLGKTVDNGDGDGVDVDGVAYIENWGRIEGTGAGGLDSGGNPNGADGIAAGGGTIINHAGASIFGQAKGILIDDGAGTGRGTATATGAAVRIENAGTITGADEAAIGLVGNFDDYLLNSSGGVITGGLQTTRVDDSASSLAAAAVQMGGGNDTLINAGTLEGRNGLAVDLGAGDDTLTVRSSARFIGSIDGGSGNDRVVLDDVAGGSFGNSLNMERLEVRNGDWTLAGSDFSSGAQVFGGAGLRNDARILGDVQVDSGAVYSGGHIAGSLNLVSGSTLVLQVNADGTANSVRVDGSARLAGANLSINALPGSYPVSSRYSVVQASGGVTGQFASVSSRLAFLTPTVEYRSDQVDVQLTRNDVSFADVARSGNGRNVATALAGQTRGGLYQALVTSTADGAGAALEQLAASSNASVTSINQASTAQLAASMRGALLQMGASNNLQASLLEDDAPVLAASGVPQSARHLNDPDARGRLWIQGLGSHGKLDGRQGSADTRQDTRGAVIGADWGLSSAWRVGVLGGYSRTEVETGSANDSDVDSLHLGLYAQRQDGPMALRLGASYSHHDNDSTRRIAFNGFSDRLRGNYDANSQQAFAELGYQLGHQRLAIEPFAALGYQRYAQDAYREKGGSAALRVDKQDRDNVSSTLGLRLAHLGTLDNGMSLTPRASLAWRHTLGDLDSRARQAFLSGGTAFSVEGTALDRNSVLVDTGLDLGISTRQNLGLGYSGEFGSHAQNHALVAQWQLRF